MQCELLFLVGVTLWGLAGPLAAGMPRRAYMDVFTARPDSPYDVALNH